MVKNKIKINHKNNRNIKAFDRSFMLLENRMNLATN